MIDMPDSFSEREIDELIGSLHKRKIDLQLNELQNKIQDAARRNDTQEILEITQQIIQLKRTKG